MQLPFNVNKVQAVRLAVVAREREKAQIPTTVHRRFLSFCSKQVKHKLNSTNQHCGKRQTGFKYTGKVQVIGHRATRHRWTQ